MVSSISLMLHIETLVLIIFPLLCQFVIARVLDRIVLWINEKIGGGGKGWGGKEGSRYLCIYVIFTFIVMGLVRYR